MTMIFPVKVNCPVCGNEIEIFELASTNRSGASDLDLRPPEMMRSTMNTWVHECPECGYVAADFDKESPVGKEFLETESYKTCDGHDFESDLSGMFYREYLINYTTESQFYSLLHCAWTCDDVEDTENAIEIRKRAIELIDVLIENSEDSTNLEIMKADLMRRSKMFDETIEEYSNKDFGEEFLNKICDFQVAKAKESDSDCYTLEDVQKF